MTVNNLQLTIHKFFKKLTVKGQLSKVTKGQALIELVLVMGLAALIIPALFSGFATSREGKVEQAKRVQAVAMLKEVEQAVKSVRINSWTAFANLTHDVPYHTAIVSSRWTLVSGAQTTNGLTQSLW